jgi:hypothetical protein
MDPASVHRSPAAPAGRWSPRPAVTAAAAGGAVVAVVLAAAADPAGRVLFGAAAIGLLALTVADLVLRPRLAADPGGLQVRTLAVRRRLLWSELQRVEVDERSRYGLTTRTLELDAGDTLVVLGRRALGTDPRDVADALARIRYTNRPTA